LFWVTSNPHIFAKTLFSFQGTTCDARKRRCFILPDLCPLVKNFFSDLAVAFFTTAFIILLN
ncbi:MAG: hypothetical protein ACRC1X_02140, partial [Lactobacillus panisapium]